ncbi:hypothetical protein JB92DRAFT_2837943 [Gautieria morchelliformis]|nr:hypothetical protein JB92DRAFT_2837943 [Gautieria morchelliformis]
MPPNTRRPGRPPKKFRKPGRQTRNDNLRIFNTTSSPPAESPHTASITSSNDSESDIIITPRRRAYLDMVIEAHSLPPPDLSTNRSNKPLLLDSVQRLAPVWKDVGHVLTTKLPDWFDAQCNDYNPYRATTSVSVDQSWFGHPNDTPVDVRARPFILDVRQPFYKGGSLPGLNTSAEEPVPWYQTHLTLRQSPIRKINVLILSCNAKTVGNNAQVK